MESLDDTTTEELRNLQQQKQAAANRFQHYVQGLLRGAGYDPETATIDLQQGVIREQDEEDATPQSRTPSA